MSFEIGDRVTWSKYPEYGTGTVLFDPGAETHLSVVFDEFDYEGFDDTVSRYHTPKSEDLTLVGDHVQTLPVGEDEKSDFEMVAGNLADLEKAVLNVTVTAAEVEQIRRLLDDDVHHPAHYNQGKIEVWDFIYDQGLGYALGNAVKYEVRAGKKAGNSKVKDLRKAIAFLEREIRFEETGE